MRLRPGDDPLNIKHNPGRLVKNITTITGATFPFGGQSAGLAFGARLVRVGETERAFQSEGFAGSGSAWKVRTPPRLEFRVNLAEWNSVALQMAYGALGVSLEGGQGNRLAAVESIATEPLLDDVFTLTWVPNSEDTGIWVHFYAVAEMGLVDGGENLHALRERHIIPVAFEARPDASGRKMWEGTKQGLAAALGI